MFTKENREENRRALAAATEIFRGITYVAALKYAKTGEPARQLAAQFPAMTPRRLRRAEAAAIRAILSAESRSRHS